MLYDTVLTVERRVSHEGMVAVGGNFYFVPDTIRRRRVRSNIIQTDRVCIFEDGLITNHPMLDVNRTHPVRPVLSVGGALVGMVRRAQEGTFDLAPSLHGVLARRREPAGNGGFAHSAAGREKDEDRGSNAP